MKTSTNISAAATLPVLLLTVFFFCASAYAIPESTAKKNGQTGTAKANSVIGLEEKKNSFLYTIEGRPDPFIPFITEKATTAKLEDVLPVAQGLSGMQLFEPGQLNLVAIVMSEKNDFAMAEDFTGKGYILRSGMLIGKRGVITDIDSNRVVIEETAFTRAGKKLTSKVVMLLKKEGEE